MNVTRHEAEKAKWQHSMAQWSAGNFTVKEFRRVSGVRSTPEAVFLTEVKKALK